MIELGLYLEIDLLAIYLMLMMMRGIQHSQEKTKDDRHFHELMRSMVWILAVDAVTQLVDERHFLAAFVLNNLAEVLYFALTGVLSMRWFFYALYKADEERQLSQRQQWLCTLPCVVLTVVAALSPWLGFLFYIDAQNVYHRGYLFWFQALVAWGYLAGGSMVLICAARKEHLKARQQDLYQLSSFSLYPLVGSLIQSAFYGLTVVWPVSACALMMIYMDQQNRRIVTDALTGINNRGMLDSYLHNEVLSAAKVTQNDAQFMILLDVDHFKSINDTYGHAVGDVALIRIANVLKRAVAHGQKNDQLFRYGGDEFAILCRRTYVDEVEALMAEIERELEADNARAGDIRLELSMGYARMEKGSEDVDKLVTQADAQMYETKRKRHEAERKNSATKQ